LSITARSASIVSPLAVRTPLARPARTTMRSTSTSVSHVPPWSRISCTSASASRAPPPRGIGMPPSCTATAITCVMKPEVAASGPSPVCSTHGASRPCARSEVNVWVSQSRLDWSSSPMNSAAPARPRRRRAFAANASPDADQSSVPSTPNARSAFGKKRSSTSAHAGPSSCALPSAVRSRNDASPSGNAVAVGSSVFRYSSPRAARSSPSCACAAPPSQSFRSRTATRQPARARSAPHASELIPLPTMTASYSAIAVGDERAELVVGDEAPLARSELLHLREQLGATFLRHVEPELVRLDPDRVDAALLSEHDRALGRDEARRVRLDRGRVVELRRDRAGLPAEERLAGDGLPRLERIAGERTHTLGDVADPLEAEVRLDAVERAQRHRHLAEVRVAGAFAHPVDRSLYPGRARADGGDGGGGGEPEVVVAVEVNRNLRADPLDRPADEVGHRLGRRDAERVDDDDLARAGLDRRLVHPLVEVGLRTRRVDAEERGVDVVLVGETH